MNLSEQATQPSNQEYRTCPVCGGPVKRYKPSRQSKHCSALCAFRRNLTPNPEPTEEEIQNGIRRIALSQGQYVVVDADQFDFLNQWRWHAVWKHKTRSFVAVRNGTPEDGTVTATSRGTVYMARVIMGAPKGMIVDHKDHDTLDNRRTSLRVVNDEENTRNARKHVAKTSRFKGVSFYRKKWNAHIFIDGVKVHLAAFDASDPESEENAARAYRLAAIKYYGEFACAETLADI